MQFSHSPDIWHDFPELAAGVLSVDGIGRDADVDMVVARFAEVARLRLATATEGELPEIRAWRRAFSRLGLKPTQYRCAAEALLRRFRREEALPRLHPAIDLCNAVSMAFAVPVAVFDVARVDGFLEVRYAAGDELYETFGGEVEHPAPREVVFADASRRAHARRWTNRQSGYSAVRDTTSAVLIVAEALHATAATDIQRLVETLAAAVASAWPAAVRPALLSASAPRFEF